MGFRVQGIGFMVVQGVAFIGFIGLRVFRVWGI